MIDTHAYNQNRTQNFDQINSRRLGISMNDQKFPVKLFTLEEANATLPLVRAITKDIVDLSTQINQTKQRLESLAFGPIAEKSCEKKMCKKTARREFYAEEIEDIQYSLESDAQRLNRYVDELMELGVEPKGLDGLVDFYAIHNDELIFLCWKYDEPEITHWHRIEDGFAGRKRIDPKSFYTEPMVQDCQF